MSTSKKRLPGVVVISAFYCFGVAALIVAMFTNPRDVGVQIANVHGLRILAGLPILIVACAAGLGIAAGLYNMTCWGYWFTLIYVFYLLLVPPIVVGKDVSVCGNLVWPLVVIVYLVLRKKQYFGLHADQGP